ncbi:hypothetical protein ACLOJK_004720 [Asimina triloba]
MGNSCARSSSSPVVHPSESEPHQPKNTRPRSGALQIKVRMTARKFKELLDEADEVGRGAGQDLGQLILRECLRGKCRARFVGSRVESEEATNLVGSGKVRNPDTITEEEN